MQPPAADKDSLLKEPFHFWGVISTEEKEYGGRLRDFAKRFPVKSRSSLNKAFSKRDENALSS